MDSFPFELPESLATYVDQFENDPQKAIKKLEYQIQRLGNDAVAHFVLAWFYYKTGKMDKAIDYALKSKTYAPGSPFFEYLHYYLIHPQAFKAWIPENIYKDSHFKTSFDLKIDLLQDLDTLIKRLTEAENNRIKIDNDQQKTENKDLSIASQSVDDIASETLAQIYKEQGENQEAIKIYKKLCEVHPENKERYLEQINDLKED